MKKKSSKKVASKPAKTKAPVTSEEKSPVVKARVPPPSTTITFTADELCFLRDLMGTLFAGNLDDDTVSSVLATNTEREEVEEEIWCKVCDACEIVAVPVGETTPDYVIAPTAVPAMSVFELPKENAKQKNKKSGMLFD